MEVEERPVLGNEGFMNVRQLTIHGSNFDIGLHLGKLAIERYGTSPTDYETEPLYSRARRLYVQKTYPFQWERIRGVAAAFGIAPSND
jgi:hypothetical protein